LAADKQVVHDRYKDLAEVERGFRTSKTGHLEVRPVYVRKEKNTRGHVLVVMPAYLVERAPRRAWAELDMTVQEGLEQLKTICSLELRTKHKAVAACGFPSPAPRPRRYLRPLTFASPRPCPIPTSP
jgi:hypothetical protein